MSSSKAAEVGKNGIARSPAATKSTNNGANKNADKNDKQFYAIGFGSNYFHPFGASAISLNDIYAQAVTPPQPINGSIITEAGAKTNHCTNDVTDSNSNSSNTSNKGPAQEMEIEVEQQYSNHSNLPSAFVFPLHPNQNSSSINTNAAKQQTKSFLRFLKRKKKQTNKKQQPSNRDGHHDDNDTSSSANVMQQALASVAQSDRALELPYAYHQNPAQQLAAGRTHVAFISNHDDNYTTPSHQSLSMSKSQNQSQQGIYMTGTMHGVTYPHPTHKLVKIPLKCTQIACGRRHTLAVFEGKVTMSWGSGYFGQLGHGLNNVYCHEPTIIERLMPRNLGGEVVAVEAGGMQSAVIVAGDSSQWKDRSQLKEIHTRVFRFGSNKHGQCAVEGGKCNAVAYPTLMVEVHHPDTRKRVSFVSLALGKLHTVGLSHQGELYSWGSTASGRCGHGDVVGGTTVRSAMKLRNGVSLPKRIEALRNVKISDITAGDAHTLALSGSGRVFSWGNNASGQLGVGHSMHLISPRLVADIEFAQIARGFGKGELSQAAEAPSTDEGISDIGEVQGDQAAFNVNVGRLGAALAPIHYPSTPQKKASQKGAGSDPIPPQIVSIHASGAYSAAVSSTGEIYSWGCCEGNQLGHPGPIAELPNSDKLSVPRTGLGQRTRDVKSFDSKLNVLLPRRVDSLRRFGLKAESLVTSSNFMLAICSKLEKHSMEDEESYLMGRTLYELENERRERGLDRIRLLRGVRSQVTD
eukprot:scaffold2116_cov140-Chaetoceros_neogracile.AAC.24